MSTPIGSVFDADQFLNVNIEGDMATRFTPIPAGSYSAVIKEVKARHLDANERNPAGRTILDVTYSIDNPTLAQQLNRQDLTVRQSVFLDLTPAGALDLGPNKNVTLGRLRAAVGQNTPGQAWSPRMLNGAGPVLIDVQHEPDKNDASILYERVKSVAKAA